MRKIKEPQRITQKDIEFFEYLHAVKIATIQQINDHVYRYRVKHVLYKRLRAFEMAGWIEGFYCEVPGARKSMSLTRKGFRRFVANGHEQWLQLKSHLSLLLISTKNLSKYLERSLG